MIENLKNLMVMQEGLRYIDSIPEMARFVANGGLWTKEALEEYAVETNTKPSSIIQITKFPDGVLAIHDGSHRTTSCLLGGRNKLFESEYKITEWTYESYLEINFDFKWVTPFDPKIHNRIADFSKFKNKALSIAETNKDEAIKFILQNPQMYRCDKNCKTVEDLASKFNVTNCYDKENYVKEIYSNWSMYTIDGKLLNRCSKDRADWYLSRDIAEICGEKSIRLKFVPKGGLNVSEEYKKFYLEDQENRCVSCGATQNLTKHHCVPKVYRRLFPSKYKDRSHHDVLILCRKCHRKYETCATEYKKTFEAKNEVVSLCWTPASKYAHAIVNYNNIPLEKKTLLLNIISKTLSISLEELTTDKLKEISAYKVINYMDHKSSLNKLIGSMSDEELQKFIVKWREHFVSTMQPKFLPKHWDVNHDAVKAHG